ncbi:MAG: glycerate kinase [Eubacteriales bacterium]|nr:glycerate kinase [Eubacteriales bacterium]
MSTLREDAQSVIDAALASAQPKKAVARGLGNLRLYGGRLRVIAIGKAAWGMADAVWQELGARIDQGLVITQYGHARGPIPRFTIMEAGHPIPDENSVRATDTAIAMVQGLTVEDTVLMLISGGGSALFEKPLIPLPLYATTTNALFHCGANITEMNIIRRRLSAVKGGRFARLCAPAGVVGLLLSDVLGDAPETIASGPISPDPVTAEQAERTLARLFPNAPPMLRSLMRRETPKFLPNAETHVIGNVQLLVRSAARALRKLGYDTCILTDRLGCEAREAGRFLGSIALTHQGETRSVAYLVGGETVVHVNGTGKGGRNQELALAAAPILDGLRDTALFSLGSDGTDGPTDAAGGFVDHRSAGRLRTANVDILSALDNNDSYNALRACHGLLMTGPTGTNVNDIAAVMIRR